MTTNISSPIDDDTNQDKQTWEVSGRGDLDLSKVVERAAMFTTLRSLQKHCQIR